MTSAGSLIDKSALVRLGRSADPDSWASYVGRGLVRITALTLLEVGYSARAADDLRLALAGPPLSSMPIEYLTPAIQDRTLAVLQLLAERGQHRAPSIPDLIVAATAELAGLTVLHVDEDFDLRADEVVAEPNRLSSPSTQFLAEARE